MICAQLWTRNDTRAEVWLAHSHTRVYAFRTCASLESADTMRAGCRWRHFHFLILRHASSSERDVASCHSPPASRHAVLFSRSFSSAGCFVDLSHLPPSAVFECFNPVPSASVVPWSSVSAENEAARTCEEAELLQHLQKTVKNCNRHLSKRAGPHSPSVAPAETLIPGVVGGARGHFALQLALRHLPTDDSNTVAVAFELLEHCMKCQAVINICHFGVINKSETKRGSRAFAGKSNTVTGGKCEELKTFDNYPR